LRVRHVALIVIASRRRSNLISRFTQYALRWTPVTAYDPDESCKPFNDGFTSIGLPVGDGIFAVNPKKIAYGSLLHIPEINKYGIAGDTGAAMRRNPRSIDIFIPLRKDALKFGRRRLEVELVEFGGS